MNDPIGEDYGLSVVVASADVYIAMAAVGRDVRLPGRLLAHSFPSYPLSSLTCQNLP
jgi:hypothetical protein